MTYWDYIHNYIKDVKMVYFAIGCGMEQYHFKENMQFEVTEKNNQQYPCFLNKFSGKKLIVLIDSNIEQNLIIKEYFNRIEQPLKEITNNNSNIRILTNEFNIVIAVKDNFYFETNNYMTKDGINNIENNMYNFNNMLSYCLENQIKMIVQDFTGRDLTSIYMKFLEIYDNNLLLCNVIFDVTQHDGGCYIDLKPSYAKTDKNGNFIQAKYLPLIENINTEFYKTLLEQRINILNYPLVGYYQKLLTIENYSEFTENQYFDNYKLFFMIYNIQFDPNDKIKSLFKLIISMVTDIVKSKQGTMNEVESIIQSIGNCREFYNKLKIFKN